MLPTRAGAKADMVVRMAFDTKLMSSSNNGNTTKLPASAGTRAHPDR